MKVNAADREPGDPDLGCHPAHQFQTDRPDIRLGGGLKNRPHPEVIGPIGFGLERLFQRMRGTADQHARPHPFPDLPDRRILMPHMDAVGSNLEGDFHPVIDHEKGIFFAGARPERFCRMEELPIRAHLIPPLDDIGAAPDCGPSHRDGVTRNRRPVNDDVEFCFLYGRIVQGSTL